MAREDDHARPITILLGTILLASPLVTHAQSGTTQSRDGLGTGAHPNAPTNSAPAGSENATSGPQSRPAFPSGSDTANPGAAFTRNQPKPTTGALGKSPGALSRTTTQGGKATTRPGGTGATEEGVARAPTAKR